jgi:ribosomal protein S18 acetylase RimI-like enzyme
VSSGEPVFALRPARQDDREFLARVYASTRAEELAPLPWNDAQKQAFLAQQFHAQSADYAANYPDASFDVVLVDGKPAGRSIVARREGELHVVDLALLPEHRGRGIGTGLMASLLDEADECAAKVTIYVERFNRALRLWERMGFRQVQEAGVYLKMERPPADDRVSALASRSTNRM